jgi:hypothetical protein
MQLTVEYPPPGQTHRLASVVSLRPEGPEWKSLKPPSSIVSPLEGTGFWSENNHSYGRPVNVTEPNP